MLNLPANYETGFLIGTSAEITATTSGVEIIEAHPTVDGSGNYVGKVRHNTRNDEVYYYRAYVKDNSGKYYYADSKQFGLTDVDLGTGLQWANINVDAATPEEIGLNGIPTGKYEGTDPAYAEFGGVWRIPSETEKQQLLTDCDWTQETIYGVTVYKVSNKADASKFIYLTSNDPSEWGYRGVKQTNVDLDDGNKVFLRTDSTNWRAGYSNSDLFATLVGTTNVLDAIQERGFVIGTSANVTHTTDYTSSVTSSESEQSASAFQGVLSSLGVGTFYFRAYVKYGDKYYYADNARQMGIDFIDLGLPSGTKWACCNVGASDPIQYGEYFSWGETAQKDEYNNKTYSYCHAEDGDYSLARWDFLGEDIGGTQYDAAYVKWGENWRMPNLTDITELINHCEYKPVDTNIHGLVFTGPNQQSIFLPSGYWAYFTRLSDVAYTRHQLLSGFYWTSSQNMDVIYDSGFDYTFYEYLAFALEFNAVPTEYSATDPIMDVEVCEYRHGGMNIRPIQNITSSIDMTQQSDISLHKGIYTVQGTKISDDQKSTTNLPKGIYIVNGKKLVVK